VVSYLAIAIAETECWQALIAESLSSTKPNSTTLPPSS